MFVFLSKSVFFLPIRPAERRDGLFRSAAKGSPALRAGDPDDAAVHFRAKRSASRRAAPGPGFPGLNGSGHGLSFPDGPVLRCLRRPLEASFYQKKPRLSMPRQNLPRLPGKTFPESAPLCRRAGLLSAPRAAGEGHSMQVPDLISFTFWLILSAALVKLQMEEKRFSRVCGRLRFRKPSLRRAPAAEHRKHRIIANTLYNKDRR